MRGARVAAKRSGADLEGYGQAMDLPAQVEAEARAKRALRRKGTGSGAAGRQSPRAKRPSAVPSSPSRTAAKQKRIAVPSQDKAVEEKTGKIKGKAKTKTGKEAAPERPPAAGLARRGKYSSVTATDIGLLFGITKQAVGQWPKAGCPRNIDGTYDLAAVIAWKLDKASGEDGDLGVGGGNSPALEKYRLEKAKIARLQRMTMEGTLIQRESVHSALSRLAPILRQAGERLGVAFGSPAQRLIEEALDDWAGEVTRVFGKGGS